MWNVGCYEVYVIAVCMSTLDGLNDLNCWILYVNTYYVDQGLSTFFVKCF